MAEKSDKGRNLPRLKLLNFRRTSSDPASEESSDGSTKTEPTEQGRKISSGQNELTSPWLLRVSG